MKGKLFKRNYQVRYLVDLLADSKLITKDEMKRRSRHGKLFYYGCHPKSVNVILHQTEEMFPTLIIKYNDLT